MCVHKGTVPVDLHSANSLLLQVGHLKSCMGCLSFQEGKHVLLTVEKDKTDASDLAKILLRQWVKSLWNTAADNTIPSLSFTRHTGVNTGLIPLSKLGGFRNVPYTIQMQSVLLLF